MTLRIQIILLLVIGYIATPCLAAEVATHSVYRITTYNLGAIFNENEQQNPYHKKDFAPLMITGATSDILNSEYEGSVSWTEIDDHTSNTSGLALSATFDASPNIALQGSFGYTKNLLASNSKEDKNESSWEANLGIIYKLVDNLSYELHLGYMDTGDLYTDRSNYSDVESIIMISNKLTLSF